MLKDKIASDIPTVFINQQHFASEHNWNGVKFVCVVDEEMALKRKNNNVADIGWDNNTSSRMIYVEKSKWPGRLIPNEHGFLDNVPMKIVNIQDDMGMLGILLSTIDPKAVAM